MPLDPDTLVRPDRQQILADCYTTARQCQRLAEELCRAGIPCDELVVRMGDRAARALSQLRALSPARAAEVELRPVPPLPQLLSEDDLASLNQVLEGCADCAQTLEVWGKEGETYPEISARVMTRQALATSLKSMFFPAVP